MSTDQMLIQTHEGVVIRLHVQPGARREQIVGLHQNRLKIAVTDPPDRGRANAAVIRLLSDVLQIPRSQIQLLRGATSRQKDVLLMLQHVPQIQASLDGLLPSEPS